MSALRTRLEALEQRRRAGDGPARARDALANMGDPRRVRDPSLATSLREFKIRYSIETHATASAVVADLAGSGITLETEDAQAALEAYRRSAADHFARFRNSPHHP